MCKDDIFISESNCQAFIAKKALFGDRNLADVMFSLVPEISFWWPRVQSFLVPRFLFYWHICSRF